MNSCLPICFSPWVYSPIHIPLFPFLITMRIRNPRDLREVLSSSHSASSRRLSYPLKFWNIETPKSLSYRITVSVSCRSPCIALDPENGCRKCILRFTGDGSYGLSIRKPIYFFSKTYIYIRFLVLHQNRRILKYCGRIFIIFGPHRILQRRSFT